MSRLRGVFALVLAPLVLGGRGAAQPGVGTVPFIFDDNRVFAEVAFVRPDGTFRHALAFVDLGTPAPEITTALYHELQVNRGRPLRLRIGQLEIPIASSTVNVSAGEGRTGPNGRATMAVEAVLPGSVVKDYQVIFNFGARTLTLGRPGTFTPDGIAVPCRVNERTGLVSMNAVVAGRTYAVAVDPGSAYSWIRADVAREWTAAHPTWNRGTGAVGEANMQTRPGGAEARATILRVPEIDAGALRLRRIGMLGVAAEAPPFPPVPGGARVSGTFFDWYSEKAPERVIGWLGGNVLKGFQVTIDFPHERIYWKPQADLNPHDLDQVGLTLARRDGRAGYFVAGIATKDGVPTVHGVHVGDRLVQIGNLVVSGATRGALFNALHGSPGEVRTLVIDRNGRRVTVRTRITAF
jgi:hypothetical protein